MNSNQKLSPKYWVIHDKTTDDVFLHTARKSMQDSVEYFYSYCGGTIGGDLDCILIEIKEVK